MTTAVLPPRDKIERSTLTGENRQVIVRGVQYPYAMTVFQQDIFWTDWIERGVFRARKDDGSGFTVLAQDLQYRPNDIHVYAGSKQESCSSSCQQFNGGCSHVCVPGESWMLQLKMQRLLSTKDYSCVSFSSSLFLNSLTSHNLFCRSIRSRVPVPSPGILVSGQQWQRLYPRQRETLSARAVHLSQW